MQQRQYGRTDMVVGVLGFGASELGFRKTSQSESDRLLAQVLDSGVNLIDTAECYLASEELLGQSLKGRRQDVYLFTKCGHAAGLDSPNWDPVTLEHSIDRSLKRLQTDHIDVIHLHTCSLEILRQGAVIEVLQRAKASGKTRYIGYSGDSEDAKYAVSLGVFDSLETSVSVADQEAVDRTIAQAVAQGMGILAKRPVANVAWKYQDKPDDSYVVAYWERLSTLRYPALTENLGQAVETALRFTLSVPGVAAAIVGTTSPERFAKNVQTASTPELPQAVYDAIRERWLTVAENDWKGLE